MGRQSFAHAVAAVTSVAAFEDPRFNQMEKLEKYVLDHEPQSVAEVIAMMDVALPNLAQGGRSDLRDVRALVRIRAWLADTRASA